MSNLNWKIKKWQEEASRKGNNIEKFCDICKDKGFIIDKRIIEKNEYEYSLRCVCKSGHKYANLMHSFERYYTLEQLMVKMTI